MTEQTACLKDTDPYVVHSECVYLFGCYVLEQRWVAQGVVGVSYLVERADEKRLTEPVILEGILWLAGLPAQQPVDILRDDDYWTLRITLHDLRA